MSNGNVRFRDGEPVRLGYIVEIFIKTLLMALMAWGVVDASDAQLDATMALVVAGIALVSILITIAVNEGWVRRKTTPTADPKDVEGRRLVPKQED